MYKAHRAMKTAKTRARKFNGKCEGCGNYICICKAYQYVDESNAAITNNSPYLCKECYEKKYRVKILTDIDRYKRRLIEAIPDYIEGGLDLSRFENIQKIIKEVD